MLALRARDTGHIQEVIIQPFRAKPGTRMAESPDAGDDDLLWTLAVARLVFGAEMSIQTPPNLAPRLIGDAIRAGIDDWGGISPVTPDFVNPEAPWPHLAALADETGPARARAGAAAPALSALCRRQGAMARPRLAHGRGARERCAGVGARRCVVAGAG